MQYLLYCSENNDLRVPNITKNSFYNMLIKK